MYLTTFCINPIEKNVLKRIVLSHFERFTCCKHCGATYAVKFA